MRADTAKTKADDATGAALAAVTDADARAWLRALLTMGESAAGPGPQMACDAGRGGVEDGAPKVG